MPQRWSYGISCVNAVLILWFWVECSLMQMAIAYFPLLWSVKKRTLSSEILSYLHSPYFFQFICQLYCWFTWNSSAYFNIPFSWYNQLYVVYLKACPWIKWQTNFENFIVTSRYLVLAVKILFQNLWTFRAINSWRSYTDLSEL